MKKVFYLSMFLFLTTVAASSQIVIRVPVRPQGFNNHSISRPERLQLYKDVVRLNIVQSIARKDGRVTPFERRRINKEKCTIGRDAFRFKHNNRR